MLPTNIALLRHEFAPAGKIRASIDLENPILALTAPGMDSGMAQDDLTAVGGKPEEFGSLLGTEIERWGALVRKRGIKTD